MITTHPNHNCFPKQKTKNSDWSIHSHLSDSPISSIPTHTYHFEDNMRNLYRDRLCTRCTTNTLDCETHAILECTYSKHLASPLIHKLRALLSKADQLLGFSSYVTVTTNLNHFRQPTFFPAHQTSQSLDRDHT